MLRLHLHLFRRLFFTASFEIDLSRYDRRDELISLFDEAWTAVSAEDAEAMGLERVQRSRLEEHRVIPLKVNHLCTTN